MSIKPARNTFVLASRSSAGKISSWSTREQWTSVSLPLMPATTRRLCIDVQNAGFKSLMAFDWFRLNIVPSYIYIGRCLQEICTF